MTGQIGPPNLLQDVRVYLSGPMDFVASRANERRYGWRNRVGDFLRQLGAVVFDPWFKPEVRGLHEYGREGESTAEARAQWSFNSDREGAEARARCAQRFWETLHIDLRMVDTSDFVIAYCPTNIYSVGTPHEIITSRQQRKPVLFVSPPVEFPSLDLLRMHLSSKSDDEGLALLSTLETEVPIKANPDGIPSLWYMPLISSEHFFDGFGFEVYVDSFGWDPIALDEQETNNPPRRPLLPFLENLNASLPNRWDRHTNTFIQDDDWLLWDLRHDQRPGAHLVSINEGQGGF